MFWIISSIATFTVLGFQKEKREGKGDKNAKNVSDEIITEKFPNLKKETDVQV